MNTENNTVESKSQRQLTEEEKASVEKKMEELRKFSHPDVTSDKLRQGALIALGLK